MDPRVTSRVLAGTEFDRDPLQPKIAWQLSVYGRVSKACDAEGGDACGRSDWGGWRAYSAERSYASPLLSNAACSVEDGAATLYFDAFAAIKTNNPRPGTFYVRQDTGHEVLKGNFSFSPHWRAATIARGLKAAVEAGAKLTLVVADEWGGEASAADLVCADSRRRL